MTGDPDDPPGSPAAVLSPSAPSRLRPRGAGRPDPPLSLSLLLSRTGTALLQDVDKGEEGGGHQDGDGDAVSSCRLLGEAASVAAAHAIGEETIPFVSCRFLISQRAYFQAPTWSAATWSVPSCPCRPGSPPGSVRRAGAVRNATCTCHTSRYFSQPSLRLIRTKLRVLRSYLASDLSSLRAASGRRRSSSGGSGGVSAGEQGMPAAAVATTSQEDYDRAGSQVVSRTNFYLLTYLVCSRVVSSCLQALIEMGVTTGISLIFALMRQNWSPQARTI